ncbi:polysaccharide biosynthesis/export family protein [Cyclobacteriaceae bacterium]|nr:polysaccharide biosynthesis/export family protein [Cyclobacteriaceae bacterium]
MRITNFRLLSLFFVTVVCLLSSCVTQKKMTLLQGQGGNVSDTLQQRLITQYEIQSGDILDIKVSSLDPSSVQVFNKAVGISLNAAVNEASLYINGYMVDHFGAINIPLIGDLAVEGITMDSLNHLLDAKLSNYFKFYTVEAKLVNYRISILGEVKRPGTQTVYNSDVNVLQALSNAGGISDHGNRRKVKIIRKAFGKNESSVIDLTDENVINSEYFYLMPNDVVYIAPHKSKPISLNVPLFALLISAASLSILVVNSVSR